MPGPGTGPWPGGWETLSYTTGIREILSPKVKWQRTKDRVHIKLLPLLRMHGVTRSLPHMYSCFEARLNLQTTTAVVQPWELTKKMVMMQNTEHNQNLLSWKLRPCNCSSTQSLSSHCGGQGSNLGQSTWNLW